MTENAIKSDSKDDSSFVLEAAVFSNVIEGWVEERGGNTTYVAKDEEKEVCCSMCSRSSIVS